MKKCATFAQVSGAMGAFSIPASVVQWIERKFPKL